MIFRTKPKKVASTRFSDFIRNASSADKKQVYKVVLARATERQQRVLSKAAAAKQGQPFFVVPPEPLLSPSLSGG